MNKFEAEKVLKQYLNPTRRQHFVKLEYLKSWSTDKKTICGIYKNDTDYKFYGLKDVCVKKDLYKIYHNFNSVEVNIIRNFYIKEKPLVVSSCEEELKMWQKQTYLSNHYKTLFPENRQLIENFEIQSGEQFQTNYEKYFYEIVNQHIKNRDSSFLLDDSLKAKFCLGIAMQYIRTYGFSKTINDNTKELLNKYEECKPFIDVEQMTLIISHIMAFKIAYHIFDMQTSNNIEYLINNQNSFLTSDMPIVQKGERDKDGSAKEMVFFFPVSPELAIIFPAKETIIRNASREEIDYLNHLTIDNSFDYVFKHN